MNYVDYRWEQCSCLVHDVLDMFHSPVRHTHVRVINTLAIGLSLSTITYHLSSSTFCPSSSLLHPFHSILPRYVITNVIIFLPYGRHRVNLANSLYGLHTFCNHLWDHIHPKWSHHIDSTLCMYNFYGSCRLPLPSKEAFYTQSTWFWHITHAVLSHMLLHEKE